MSHSIQLVIFTLDERRYALHLTAVQRIVRTVDVTPLPKAPDIALGVINVQGKIVPVVDVRKRFRLPEREMNLEDHLIIGRTSRRTVALLVDSVSGVIEYDEGSVIASQTILPGIDYVEGVVKLADGVVLIHDLDKFLSLDEEKILEEAMSH